MLWLLATSAQAQAPGITLEPVLEEAELDVRHLRRYRTMQGLTIASTAGLAVGTISVSLYLDRTPKSDLTADALRTAAITGLAASAIGSVVGPVRMHRHAGRSADALRRQGLDVPGRMRWVPTIAALTGVTAVLGSILDADNRAALALLGAVAYTPAVYVPARMARANRLARQQAGWWTLQPSFDGRAGSLALGGAW